MAKIFSNKKDIRYWLLWIFLGFSMSSVAQTYIHEPSILNQFTVMETGAGSLQPREYYNLLHKGYQATAAGTNKMEFRLKNQELTMKEISLAEKVDSDLVKRAKVEATNIATRSPGAGDVAWAMEKGKIEGMMSTFDRNINKIVSFGGTVDDYNDWKSVYDCLSCAIKLTRNAYLDLGSRKKEYLAIHKDIVRQNLELVKKLRYWNSKKELKKITQNTGKIQRLSSVSNIAQGALNRWQDALAVDGFHKNP